MKGYKVVAKFGPDTVKFYLPIGCEQDTLEAALMSARRQACIAFGILERVEAGEIPYEHLKVTVTEVYED